MKEMSHSIIHGREESMKTRLCATLFAWFLWAAAAAAWAQGVGKPIRLLVPFPAGGPSDTVARVVAQALTKTPGRQLIVDNRPGVNGLIATKAALQAPADGYTLLYGVGSMLALPMVQSGAGFDWVADFAPISTLGQFEFGLFVHPGMSARTVSELAAQARAKPGEMRYAASTLSEYLAAAQLVKVAQIDMIRVPYKGSTQALPDLIAGRIEVYFTPLSAGLPYAKDGRLRLMATLLPQRSTVVPDVPTMAEAGMRGVTVPSWQAVFAPAKMPPQAIQELNRDINVALQDRGVRAQLERQALHIEGSTPDAFARIIRTDLQLWEQFIRENDIPRE
jgi:tripartite-type tricarboxylate transporter receptor subunit TctC